MLFHINTLLMSKLRELIVTFETTFSDRAVAILYHHVTVSTEVFCPPKCVVSAEILIASIKNP